MIHQQMNKLVLGALLVALLRQPAAADLFKATEFTLSNGMRGVVVENHKAPIIKHMVWYQVGAVDETPEQFGLAHLLEHLMFRGTTRVENGEFNRIINELGAESNAFTGYDVTAYHQFADIKQLEALMALEADRMQNLNLTEQDFDSEQKIVFQERKQVVENNPAAVFNERLSMMLHGNSRYGRPIGGFDADIKGLTLAQAQQFYRQFYAPNNAILVLSGDIDAPTAQQLAEKYYGIVSPKNITRAEPDEKFTPFAADLTMALPHIQTPKIIDKYLLPNYRQLSGNVYAYAVLAEYLGGGETSALYRDLVLEQKVAVGVSVDFHFVTRGNSVFSVSMLPAEDISPVEARELLYAAVSKAMSGLTTEKLKQTQRKMTADLVYVNDNPEDAAYWIGTMLSNGFNLSDIENYAANIEKINLKDVQAAYRAVMQASKTSGTLLPENYKAPAPRQTVSNGGKNEQKTR